MAIFYVLPSRPLLGGRLATFLRQLLPGVQWSHEDWAGLADDLVAAAIQGPDVYVVHRDELPDNVAVEQALAAAFGAEPGDKIIEVSLGQSSRLIATDGRRLEAA